MPKIELRPFALYMERDDLHDINEVLTKMSLDGEILRDGPLLGNSDIHGYTMMIDNRKSDVAVGMIIGLGEEGNWETLTQDFKRRPWRVTDGSSKYLLSLFAIAKVPMDAGRENREKAMVYKGLYQAGHSSVSLHRFGQVISRAFSRNYKEPAIEALQQQLMSENGHDEKKARRVAESRLRGRTNIIPEMNETEFLEAIKGLSGTQECTFLITKDSGTTRDSVAVLPAGKTVRVHVEWEPGTNVLKQIIQFYKRFSPKSGKVIGVDASNQEKVCPITRLKSVLETVPWAEWKRRLPEDLTQYAKSKALRTITDTMDRNSNRFFEA
jgi:hypothetical protein